MYQIIINPASRSGKGLSLWQQQIEPILQKNKIEYQAHLSGKQGDVERITKELTSNASASPIHLIVLGGDGTVNEALQGIVNASNVILGYIPTGSSNDLARDLSIPSDPLAALDLILHTGKIQPMDVGTVSFPDGEKRRFAVSCGIGYDAAICEEATHSKIKTSLNKIGLGKLTYLGIALKQLFQTKAVSAELILDSNEPITIGNMLFITSMIHRYEGGGFMFCPNADYTDGIIDLCAVGDLPIGRILRALPTAFKGKHYRFEGVTPYKAKSVTINVSSPMWVHTDGEVSMKSESITVSCEIEAIRILVP